MAIGTNGLFARGIGITGASFLGLFYRGFLDAITPPVTSADGFWITRSRRRR